MRYLSNEQEVVNIVSQKTAELNLKGAISSKTRQQIIDAKSSDMKLFYKLVNKHTGKLKHCVNELLVYSKLNKSECKILTV